MNETISHDLDLVRSLRSHSTATHDKPRMLL